MRISDRAVFQDVDGAGEYVIVVDGDEIVLTADEVARLVAGVVAAFYGRDPNLTPAITDACTAAGVSFAITRPLPGTEPADAR